jgi:hypothetical protein
MHKKAKLNKANKLKGANKRTIKLYQKMVS